MIPIRFFFLPLVLVASLAVVAAEPDGQWAAVFDGQSLDGWHAQEQTASWSVENGELVAIGPRGHLFLQSEVVDQDLVNFELKVELRTEGEANSGIFFHTHYKPQGTPDVGYEVEIDNRVLGSQLRSPHDPQPIRSTGSLSGVRDIYRTAVRDRQWFTLRVKVIGNRVQIWVNDFPTVDYLQPQNLARQETHAGRRLGHGTIALQSPDGNGRVTFRRIDLRVLSPEASPADEARASEQGYAVEPAMMDRFAEAGIAMIDYHVHLRGGMTVEKAIDRQAVTGFNVGVLRNQGQGWPVETDRQFREFLDLVEARPVFVGLQVNDRDWFTKHDASLLRRLDFVLADTMIMPMPNDSSPPVKLFQPDQFTIEDPHDWMERYVQHNLRVLAEPVTILANPTWLPEVVAGMYDERWTDARMRTIAKAAIDNGVAFEINANSGYPRERFIRIAKNMGAKFTFGSNNFDDLPHDMSRCLEAIQKYDSLTIQKSGQTRARTAGLQSRSGTALSMASRSN